MGRRWLAGGVLMLLVMVTGRAQACTPVAGYVRPSNFELVQIAEAIVVATPISERRPKSPDGFPGQGGVTFHVNQALKGNLSGDVEVRGFRLGRTQPSAANDIRFPHPESYAGACNRMTFSLGGAYLLFLARVDGGYMTLGYPFSRVSEDYLGPDSLWTRTVRSYLDVQRTQPPMGQLDRLEALRASLLAGKTPGDAQRAADIADHLGSISPWKPTAFLLDALRRANEGRPPRYPPRKGDFDVEQSDAEATTDVLMKGLGGKAARRAKPPRSAAQQHILDALIEGGHPDAEAVFAPFARPGAPPDELAMALRFMANNGRFHQTYDLIEGRAETALSAAPQPAMSPLLWTIASVMDEDHSGPGAPRWRTDPYTAQRWPKLALRLTRLAQARGVDPPFSKTLLTLVGSDYRAHPELTLAVSGDDNAITGWAEKELTRPQVLAGPRAEGWADPLTLPLRIHLRWQGLSGDEGEAALVQVACAGSPERQLLFGEWGREGGSNSILAILRLSLTPGMTDADRAVLAGAMVAWDARYKAERGESWIAASEAARKIARRETPTLEDVAPIKPPTCAAR